MCNQEASLTLRRGPDLWSLLPPSPSANAIDVESERRESGRSRFGDVLVELELHATVASGGIGLGAVASTGVRSHPLPRTSAHSPLISIPTTRRPCRTAAAHVACGRVVRADGLASLASLRHAGQAVQLVPPFERSVPISAVATSKIGNGVALRHAIEALGEREGRLLAVLGLAGPGNITKLTRLAGLAGVRASASRQFSTTGLREVLEGLTAKGLVDIHDDHYRCARGVGFAAMKVAHVAGSLATLASAVDADLHPRGGYFSGSDAAAELFRIRVLFASNDPRAGEAALRSNGDTAPLTLATEVLLPALSPVDDEWLGALTPSNREALLAIAMPVAEALAIPIHDACHFIDTRTELIQQSVGEARSALGALAIVRGDFEAARRIAACPGARDASRGIEGSLALLDGRIEDAIAAFDGGGTKAPPLTGLARLLHVYALLARGQRVDLDAAARIAAQRARGRNDPVKQAIAFQKALVEFARSPSEMPRFIYEGAPAHDAYSGLVRGHFALWFDAPEHEVIYALYTAHDMAEACERADNAWLRDQYRGVARSLFDRLGGKIGGGRRPIAPPPAPSVKLKLWALRGGRASWETALEGIEQLSRSAMGGAGAEEAAEESERIVWRVRQYGRHFMVEPILQKRSRGAFTKGRALALKHLTGNESALLRRLPPEDRRIVAQLRVRHETYGGYPRVEHFFAPEVARVLVGHPRVFLEESSEPIDVVLGTVRVLVQAKDGHNQELELTIEPGDLSEPIEMRREAHRLVVYELPEPVRALVKIVGPALTFPEAVRQRAMDALGGLSHLVAVHSSAGGTGRAVPAHPEPWLRLVPRGMSIAVSARVRPLGKEGPEVAPGRGAPTLVSRIGGETLEVTRDLALEQTLAARAFEACGLLDAGAEERATSDHEWQGLTPDDPQAALELVSRLRELGDAVHVEWPEGVPFRLRPRVGRRQLRGALSSGVDFFLASGSLELGEDLHVDLEELLALVAARPGRFVELASGEYLELEQDLRDLLDSVASARLDDRPGKRRGIALPRTAVAVLERLADEGQGLTPDAGARAYQQRLLEVAQKLYRIPRALQAELRPYQAEGFQWLCRLAELELGACLADDMGLGKTVQLIALLLQRVKEGPALVVAPTSVCENWRRELCRFAPSLEVRQYVGQGRAELLDGLGEGVVVVTSYAILQQDAEALAALEFATTVLDEAQLVKNAESQRARAAFALRGRFRVVSTGTPVENHVGDLHSLFCFALPGLLGTYASFNRRFGKNLTGDAGAFARRALRRLVQPFILRRTKAEVLEDLPPITVIQHSVELGPVEARLYEAVRRTALNRLTEATDDPRSRVQALAEITRLRRLCCHPALAVDAPGAEGSKVAAFLELLDELVEGRHRALVFSQFVDLLAIVRAALDARGIAYQYLDGSTKPKDRNAAVDAFQAGEGEAFLISLRAGGFGLNLTAADYVIHLDPWWNPAVESQASDRAHRIGQTRPVTVYRLVAAGTIEERIMELHRKKRDLAESVLDDTGRSATLSVEELRSLLEG